MQSDPTPTARSDELAAVLDASLEAVVGMDDSGRIRQWNSTAELMFGWKRSEVLGRTVAETIIPDRFRSAHISALRQYRETGRSKILGRRIAISALHRDGHEVPVELRIAPVASGESRFLAFISDLTEVRRLQSAHESSVAKTEAQRRLLETILANTPAGIALIIRRDYLVEFVNPAFEALSGRPSRGRPALEVWPEIADQLRSMFRKVFETGQAYHAVDRLVPLRAGAEGLPEQRFFTFTFVPIRAPEGEVDSLLVVGTETTAQVRAKQQVEQLAEVARRRATELRGIIDHMTDAVFVCDARGRLTLINTTGAALVGLDPERLEGLGIDDLAAKLEPLTHDGERHDLPLALALRGEPIVLGRTLLRAPGKAELRLLRSSAAPIRDANGVLLGAVEVARDLTDVERLDQLKGEFVRAAAHALNTPLAVLTGYGQVIAPHLDHLPTQQRKMLSAMQRGVERMEEIVRDLNYVTSIELDRVELARERLRLDEVVKRAVERASRRRAKTSVELAIVRLDPVTIEVDRRGLEQTLHNLLSNAIRYSNPGTAVEISVVGEGSEAVVSVRDRGAGIATERQKHIFERFFRAHVDTPYDFEGLGIGLYISHEMVTRQGGRMWFESVEGEGSVFHVAFPIPPISRSTP